MSKKTWLIIGISLVLAGCIILGGAISVIKWDFMKLSTTKFETNAHTITEAFKNISIETDTSHITFALSQDETCSVVCYEEIKASHSVAVENDTLTIRFTDTRRWYDHVGIHFGTPKITVYLPQSQYGALYINASTGDTEIPKDFHFETMEISQSTGDVTNFASVTELMKIRTSTGKIHVENAFAGAVDLSVSTGMVTARSLTCQGDIAVHVSTGDAHIADTTCKNLTSDGNTGDISLENVIAVETFSIERSTGDVQFNGADATEIFVKTNTGDVQGTLLSDKVFIARTDTGDVDVPGTTIGGKCEITTNTGDIKIIAKQQNT